jgi:hypothetical protein
VAGGPARQPAGPACRGGFTAVLCLGTMALFALVPVLSARGASSSLRAGTATSSPFWRRFRGALVAGQLAAALILLAGSMTLVKTVVTALKDE